MNKAEKQNQKDHVFLNIARQIASLSKCQSYKVGAVAVINDRILSTGYNGTPKGYVNCCDVFPPRMVEGSFYVNETASWKSLGLKPNPAFNREAHHAFSDKFEVHAEQNLVAHSARNGISISGATIYCTLQPCKDCTKLMIAAGISRIVYGEIYDKSGSTDEEQIQFLLANNVIFEMIS